MTEPALPGHFAGEIQETYALAVPEDLRPAVARLQFPPSYVVVGVYRLFTDKHLSIPAWEKCQHGAVRGATVAFVWVSAVT